MERVDLFGTPVVVFDVAGVEEMNREIVDRLLAEEQRTAGLQHSNYGGWHSETDLMARPQPCFQWLTRMLVDHVAEVVAALSVQAGLASPPRLRLVNEWAMVMRQGDYTLMHDHMEADWATAYYPDAGDAGDDDHSGGLAFSDPRPGLRRSGCNLFPNLFTVQPRSSSLVVFPGWLKHQVYTYQGQRPRVSISSNIVLEPA
jgi:uncharacterized protein (TIGR02466 family)